jgi:hypothetical protein
LFLSSSEVTTSLTNLTMANGDVNSMGVSMAPPILLAPSNTAANSASNHFVTKNLPGNTGTSNVSFALHQLL